MSDVFDHSIFDHTCNTHLFDFVQTFVFVSLGKECLMSLIIAFLIIPATHICLILSRLLCLSV